MAQAVESLGTEVVARKDWKADGAGKVGARGGCGSPTWDTDGREVRVAEVQSWKRGSEVVSQCF